MKPFHTAIAISACILLLSASLFFVLKATETDRARHAAEAKEDRARRDELKAREYDQKNWDAFNKMNRELLKEAMAEEDRVRKGGQRQELTDMNQLREIYEKAGRKLTPGN